MALDLSLIRSRLVSDGEKIRESMRNTSSRAALLHDKGGDIADVASQRQIASMNSTDMERLKKNLRDIDVAIQRIDDGEYGICLDCEEVIPEDRLTIRPTSVRCMPCKELLERRSKQNGASITNRAAFA